MDVLSNVLQVIRLSGAVFLTAEFTSPWAVRSPPQDRLASILMPGADGLVLFHMVSEGACWIEQADREPRRLSAGEIVVFPAGHEHVMSDAVGRPPVPIVSLLPHGPYPSALRLRHGGGGARTSMVCGYLHCAERFRPLFDQLPTMLRVQAVCAGEAGADSADPAVIPADPWLRATLAFAAAEATSRSAGTAAMLARLVEVLFVELLRRYLRRLRRLRPEQSGWLTGIDDRLVGRALQLLHDDPGRRWTVAELAREIGCSRSVLATRFTTLVGQSPMRYWADWRMQCAKHLLLEDGAGLPQIAERVGYESEAAFNRAFKRHVGMPPGSWRKATLAIST